MLCSICSQDKLPRYFPSVMRNAESVQSICYRCSKSHGLDHTWKLYPDKARNWRKRSKYGITQRDIALLLDAQDHECPGCRKFLNPSDCIDHCHDTGKIRGILCGKCNTAIGMANNDASVLERLANYLRKNPGDILNAPIANGNSAYRA